MTHNVENCFSQLGLASFNSNLETTGDTLKTFNPTTTELLGWVEPTSYTQYDQTINLAKEFYLKWRTVPAPNRGLVIRSLGERLRKKKTALAELISLEMGKPLSESLGEVQEIIDMCDFGVGLSRQLYGMTMHSERPSHRMYEQWHPLGVVGVITAFNFPMAVWGWNAVIATICGNTTVWKPSEQTPLCALAIQNLCHTIMVEHDCLGLFNIVQGGANIGSWLAEDERIPLVSATGSTKMGQSVAVKVAHRFGRSLLELGGNNAIIVDEGCNLDLAIRAILFSAIGTSGQRCTTLRRLFVHRKIKNEVIKRLINAYQQVTIGDPLKQETLMGPLINQAALNQMNSALKSALSQGGEVLHSENYRGALKGYFANPTIVGLTQQIEVVKEETFAPLLYVLDFDELEHAIKQQNDVPQGLSSAIFTNNLQHSEYFLSSLGSDCGIANVNIGTSGAEIGGAFGGEKATGGGREAGSDAWKFYMRRQTTTINWSNDLPLSQGIKFLSS